MSDTVLARHISRKAFLGPMAVAILCGVAVLILRPLIGVGHFLLWLLVAILPALFVILYAKLQRVSTTYRLFPDRLEVVSGILSRRIENVDLFRVRDVGVKQSLMGRLVNIGDIYIHSTDSSKPDLHVSGIDAPETFYRQIRQQVESSRASRQTLIVEESSAIPE